MEWQNFLNLCICQESHLKHVEDYRWVSLRAGGWGGGWGRAGAVGAGGVATRGPDEAPHKNDRGVSLWRGPGGKLMSHPDILSREVSLSRE